MIQNPNIGGPPAPISSPMLTGVSLTEKRDPTADRGMPTPPWIAWYKAVDVLIRTRELADVLANMPVLGVNDAGYRFRVTDYNHRLVWVTIPISTVAWAAGVATYTSSGNHNLVIGQTVRTAGFLPDGCSWLGVGTVTGPTTGWHLYDGTANVPYLKFDGTLGTQTLSDLTSAANKAAYPKAGSPNGGPNAAVAPGSTGGGGSIANATSTGTVNATVDQGGGTVVAAGAGSTVAAHTHVHADTVTMNAHTHTFTPTQATIDATGEPRNEIWRPWFRQ